jgi:hypothetical protein
MQVIFFTFRASQESLNPLTGIVVLVRARAVEWAVGTLAVALEALSWQ